MSPSISTKPRSETEIVKAILAYLKTVPGVVAWRQNVGAVKVGQRFVRFGFPGLSDIIGWQETSGAVPGHDPLGCICVQCHKRSARFLAIEVKRSEREVLTPPQMAFLQAVKVAGGLAFVAHSVQNVVDALARK